MNNVIIIIAGIYDANAQKVVKDWSDKGYVVKLITTKSITSNKFTCEFGTDSKKSSVVLDGVRYDEDDIEAIVTLLPCVTSYELPFIKDEDRNYVAQEIQAFLLGFLLKFDSCVINKSTASSLIGVSWRPYKWLLEMEKIGLKVGRNFNFTQINHEIKRLNDVKKVQIVGDKIIGTSNSDFITKLKKITEKFSTKLLTVEYGFLKDRYGILKVYPMVDIGNGAVSDALLDICINNKKR